MPVDYHAWTHRPKSLGGTDPIELPLPKVFRAVQWDSFTTTGTSVDMEPFAFDLWANPDTSIFEADLEVSLELGSVIAKEPGLYVVNLIVGWFDSFDAPVAGFIADGELVWPPTGSEDTRKMRAGSGDGMYYSYSLSRYYPTINFEEGHGGNDLPVFSFFAGQQSGASRDCQARVDITYWPAEVGPVDRMS